MPLLYLLQNPFLEVHCEIQVLTTFYYVLGIALPQKGMLVIGEVIQGLAYNFLFFLFANVQSYRQQYNLNVNDWHFLQGVEKKTFFCLSICIVQI